MAKQQFAAKVADWVRRTEGATEAVVKESAQEVVSEMQKTRVEGGRMRVDTGFLRASVQASTVAMPSINPHAFPVGGQKYPYNSGPIEAVIIGSDVGQTIFVGYTAAYSGPREFGARGQAPDAFVRTAAQQWPAIVNRVTMELKGRLGLS